MPLGDYARFQPAATPSGSKNRVDSIPGVSLRETPG
jgi:hypothetical protein